MKNKLFYVWEFLYNYPLPSIGNLFRVKWLLWALITLQAHCRTDGHTKLSAEFASRLKLHIFQPMKPLKPAFTGLPQGICCECSERWPAFYRIG